MSRSLRLALSVMLLAVLALGSVVATSAGTPKVIEASMVGIPAGAPTLHGIAGGGAPWIIDAGRAELSTSGKLEVKVRGLTLLSGVNPIANGRAILTCNSAAVASSPIVPFSAAGDADVETTVTVPSPCLAPAIFFVGVLPTGAERWFAVTGS